MFLIKIFYLARLRDQELQVGSLAFVAHIYTWNNKVIALKLSTNLLSAMSLYRPEINQFTPFKFWPDADLDSSCLTELKKLNDGGGDIGQHTDGPPYH